MPSRWLSLTRNRFLADPASDAALLRRYAEERDPAAFECLLWRHGGLVLGTCERMLRDKHLAEDAYQATFLILARKAGTVRGVLPAWLHKVARRVCLRIQKRWPERLTADVPEPENGAAVDHRETSAILDAEIAKLPEKHRRVVVLCYLQNVTAEAAAQELGIPRGTVLSRLDAARRKLQAALTRRGIAPIAILAIPLIHAPPSSALVQATQQAVQDFVSRAATTPITELAHEVLHMTTRKWIAGTALGVIALAFASTGVGLFNANIPATSQAVAQAPAEPPKPVVTKPVDPEEVKRLKTDQLRQRDKLEITEQDLKHRIDDLHAKLAKEQAQRDAEVNPRALQQAIDKIDQSILDEEVVLQNLQLQLDEYKSSWRQDKAYPVKLLGNIEVPNEMRMTPFGDPTPTGFGDPNKSLMEVLLAIPEYLAHLKALEAITKDSKNADSAKIEKLKKLRQETIADFEKNVKPSVEKQVLEARREGYHKMLEHRMENTKFLMDSKKAFPKSVAKRRAELVDWLRRASGVSEEQKLIEDELQILREFRRAVMKRRLALNLEIEGVILPAEPLK